MIPHFSSRTGTDIDRERRAITLTRIIAAPPERAYAAWAEPETRALWLGESALLAPGAVPRRAEPPRELVWESLGALVVVTLAPVAGSTVVTLAVHCDTMERFDDLLSRGLPDEAAHRLGALDKLLG